MNTYFYDRWERAFHEIGAAESPEIKRDYNHVDACTTALLPFPP